MKTKHYYTVCITLIAAAGLALASGCAVDQNGRMTFVLPQVVVAPPVYIAQPQVVVAQPPVVEEQVAIPENYVVVDGENIGVVGNQYYYLDSGGVWVVCDSARLEHFHAWERDHRDWREHAIHNDRSRKGAKDHRLSGRDDRRVEARHDNDHQPKPQPKPITAGKQAPKSTPQSAPKKAGNKDTH